MTTANKRVQWLGTDAPPAQLAAHLNSRGFALVCGAPGESLPPSRLVMLGVTPTPTGRPSLEGRRLAVLHPDPGSADALAQSLRRKGGEVLVLSLNPAALERVETFDPDAVIVEPTDFIGGCWDIVRGLWSNPRLRWAPVVLTPAEPLGLASLSAPDSDLVCHTVQKLSAPYDALVRHAASGKPFAVSLAVLGPARTLRALIGSGATLRAAFTSSGRTIEVDVAEHIIVGAQELDAEEPEHALLGAEALAHLLDQPYAQGSVRSVTSPAVTNVMAPLDDALHAARLLSLKPAQESGSPSYIERRAFSVPTRGSKPAPEANRTPIPAAHAEAPPGRLYAFPAASGNKKAIPPPPAPRTDLAATVTTVPPLQPARVSQPQVVDRRVHTASAAALNIDLAWEVPIAEVQMAEPTAAPALPAQDAVPLDAVPLESGEQPVSQPWEPSQLNNLLADRHDSSPLSSPSRPVSPDLRSLALTTFRAAQHWLRALPGHVAPAKQWLSNSQVHVGPARIWCAQLPNLLRAEVRKRPLLVVFISILAACLIVGLGSRHGSSSKPVSAAQASAPTVQVHIRKLAPEPTVTTEEAPADDEVEDERDVLKASSRRASALVSEGHALRREGKLTNAEALYRKALAEYPGYPRALAGLAHLAIEREHGTEAVRYARWLVRVRPQASNHLLLGDAQRLAGNMVAAKSAWKLAARGGSRVAESRLK